MIVIRTAEAFARALDSPLDPELKHCLQAHWDRLAEWQDYELSELAIFVVVQAGDTLEQAEAIIGQPLVQEGCFTIPPELVARRGGWFEATFILSDDGFGLVLLVEIADSTAPDLLAACNHHLNQ